MSMEGSKIPYNLISLKKIVEGTSTFTGQEFFESLVRNLAQVLNVHGVWVTEAKDNMKRLSALAFWLDGKFVDEYEYDVKGTPCEPVLTNPGICHIPDKVVKLYPDDPDLESMEAVSYMGLVLKDVDDTILGHLAILDNKPMDEIPEAFAIFKIFASRASAELRRMNSNKLLLANQSKLHRLVNGTMDAILELDSKLFITQSNRAALRTFGVEDGSLEGLNIKVLLTDQGKNKLSKAISLLKQREDYFSSTLIPGYLTCLKSNEDSFPAEATLSVYRVNEEMYFALYLRNVKDRVQTQETLKNLNMEAAMLREKVEENSFSDIIGDSPAISKAIEMVNQVAPTDSTVLILGETGTGKELFAQAVHQASNRKTKPLITLNCAALPPDLIESELFGHVKGAYTGATTSREGRFSMADQGTIFLDEIGEIPLQLQSKLLRVLQEGEFEQVGSSRTQRVNVRIIAATNRDLNLEVREGRFREDLFYRLSVFPIQIPPLRNRKDDVLLLTNAFINKYCKKRGIPLKLLDRLTERKLMAHSWPGNVRELQNIIERAFITSKGSHLDLLLNIQIVEKTDAPGHADNQIMTETEIQALQKENILRALEESNGRISGQKGAANLLKIPATTLNSRIKKLGIIT